MQNYLANHVAKLGTMMLRSDLILSVPTQILQIDRKLTYLFD